MDHTHDLRPWQHAHVFDTGKAEVAESAFNGFALRIQHAFFQGDFYLGFHQVSLFTSLGLARSGFSFSLMMPNRFATS